MLTSDYPMGWKMIWNLLLFVLVFRFVMRSKRFVGTPYTVFVVWQNAFGKQTITSHADGQCERLKLNAWATDGFLTAYGIRGASLWRVWRVVVTVGWWLCGALLVTLVGLGALRGQPDHFAA